MQTWRELWDGLLESWEFLHDIYDTGNFWARVAIALIVGWFVVLVISALIPLPAWPLAILPLFAAVALLFALPTAIAVAAAIPQTRGVLRWLATLLAIQLTVGLYFAGVPVSADRGLVPVLVIAAAALALFALGAGRSPVSANWLMSILMLTIVVLTAIFFAGGRQKLRQQFAAPPAIAQPRAEEFTCQAGEEVLTALVGPGSFHRIQANKPFVAVVRAAGAEYPMPAGFSSWVGGPPEGLLRVRCLHDGTALRFQKVR